MTGLPDRVFPDRPPPPRRGYPTDPGTILGELDRWAAEHDRLTEQYAEQVVTAARARHALDLAAAKARRRALAVPGRGRRTTRDLDAEVEIETETERAASDDAAAFLDATKRMLRNAEANLDRLRTHAATARTLDPRSP